MEKKEFSSRLAQLRINKGVSARDMSLSMGQSVGYINKIETKAMMPSLTGFFYICEYFGITPKEFFDFDNPAPERIGRIIEELKGLPPQKLDTIEAVLREIK